MNPVNSNKLVRVSVLNKPDMIHLGYNLTQHIASDVLANVSVSNYVIVTDAHLAQLYLEPLMKALQAEMNKVVSSSNKNNKKRLLVRILPPGELSKSRQTKQDLEDFLLSQACTRDTCLLALGGGVIGDLVGFVAATFMRGIPVVQIPTTLLAMVDSSIGGKTAIDTLHGKNLIGSFWQPERIYMDLATLQTLPKREFSNGMAEVIKTAAIWNQTDFSRLEKNRVEMQEAIQSAGNRCNQDDDDDVAQDILMQAILASVRVKAHVVGNDEREGGLRGLLNFGHTLGHAIEAILAPEWLHGECVAIGMILEAEISVALGYCESAGVVDRLKNCIASYGLPTDCSTIRDRVFVPDVMCVMKIDKKNQGTQKRIVLLSCIGATFESRPTNVPDAVILDVLHRHFAPSTSSTTVVDQVPCSPTPDAAASAPSCCLPSLVLASSNNYFSEWIKGILLPAALDQGPLKNYRLVKELSDKYNQVAVVDNLETAEESLQSGQGIILIWFTFEAGTTSLDPALEWYEYVVVPCDDGSAAAETFQVPAALAFFEKMLGIRSRQVTLDKASCFVTPTIPDYAAVPPHLLEQWVEGADAIELRVDLLEMKQSSSSFSCWVTTAGKQLAHLRSRTKLPVIFTVRTVPQAGKFDPSLIQDVYMQLLYWAHRWACEYIDIEFTTISPQQLESLANVNEKNSNYSRWIASFHDPDRLYPWSSQQLQSIYERAANVVPNKNKNAVIKLVGYAKSFADNIELEQFRQCVDPDRSKEIILINMGEYGRFSRVANYFLTPATHSTLPSAAAPGQLTIQELGYLRSALKLQHST